VNVCGKRFLVPGKSDMPGIFGLEAAMAGYPELQDAIADRHHVAQLVEIGEVADSRFYIGIKRILDVISAIVLLLLFLPLIPVVTILIKLDSPGSVLYRQKRVGKRGKEFDFYKFRSMVDGAENVIGALRPLCGVNGPSFLRRSSLDELPQLLNVLKGDMSIVGPRPNLPSEVAHYLPWQRKRLDVTPGITCFWQIAGRSHIGFEEWMRLDLEYIRQRSLKTDLMIMLKTIPAVIARKGAY
jgi:lipopolysaccharide/colanic/teichoic acid biosynthesis glycosyltransferase